MMGSRLFDFVLRSLWKSPAQRSRFSTLSRNSVLSSFIRFINIPERMLTLDIFLVDVVYCSSVEWSPPGERPREYRDSGIGFAVSPSTTVVFKGEPMDGIVDGCSCPISAKHLTRDTSHIYAPRFHLHEVEQSLLGHRAFQ